MTAATTREPQAYRIDARDDALEIELTYTAHALLWDRTFSQALCAAHEYVASTHLVPPDGARPHRLVVTVTGPLTWARIEEMEATVRRAWLKEMGA